MPTDLVTGLEGAMSADGGGGGAPGGGLRTDVT